jgi:hypothetical protein
MESSSRRLIESSNCEFCHQSNCVDHGETEPGYEQEYMAYLQNQKEIVDVGEREDMKPILLHDNNNWSCQKCLCAAPSVGYEGGHDYIACKHKKCHRKGQRGDGPLATNHPVYFV